MDNKKLTKEEEDKLLGDLEVALKDPVLRGTVGLGIYARELCSSMGVAHTILLLVEQAKRLIDAAIPNPEDRANLKLTIIEDFADQVVTLDPDSVDETEQELMDLLEGQDLTRKKKDLN